VTEAVDDDLDLDCVHLHCLVTGGSFGVMGDDSSASRNGELLPDSPLQRLAGTL